MVPQIPYDMDALGSYWSTGRTRGYRAHLPGSQYGTGQGTQDWLCSLSLPVRLLSPQSSLCGLSCLSAAATNMRRATDQELF